MAEATQQVAAEGEQEGGAGAGGPGFLNRLFNNSMRGETIMGLGIVALIVALVLPIPTWLLDISLATSITFSVVILMMVLFISKPLELSSFPTILLIATMLRLAMNIASTRLILSQGHTGTAAAGDVIQAFGGFIMQGEPIIGIVVFAILVLINFIVITKGSGRIAEVTARFTLDAMPGKQMAVDADLSSGLINEEEARLRRRELEDESSFFGAMDGAAKFVRGDAVAGLLITLINVIVGIIIGTAFKDMTLGEASQNYVFLTVGDGLVSQIPALTVSIAAGMLVTKSGVEGSTDKAVFGQVSKYPYALGMAAVFMIAFALIPGIPPVPFMFLGATTGTMAYFLKRTKNKEEEEQKQQEIEEAAQPQLEEPITKQLTIDQVRLELGYGLLALINNENGVKLTDQVKGLRKQLAAEVGFVMPSVRIQDNLQLPANTYVIRIKEIESARGEVRPNMLMVMDPQGEKIGLPGEMTTEPTFGLPAMWVAENLRDEAQMKSYTIVEPSTVVTTHLTEVIKDNMSELLSFAETQKLLDEMEEEQQKLIADVVPNQISVGGLQRVLQNLLQERISIRDMPTILEGVSEAAGYTKNIMQITEHTRGRLARQISETNTNEQGFIPLVTLSPMWEQRFAESLVGQTEDKQLAMPPSQLQEFIAAVRETFDKFAMMGESPALLTSPGIRPYVRSVIERFRPSTTVMSQNEVYAKARIKTLGQV